MIKRESCTIVRSCLDNITCENFNGYFELSNHTMNTRNRGYQVKLPRAKLYVAKKLFYYEGAKLYNEKTKILENLGSV